METDYGTISVNARLNEEEREMVNKSELDQLLNRIFKSTQETEASRTLKEIESNSEYIINTQLRKLLELHDKSFKKKCVVPARCLYEKYNEAVLRDGDLQNWAELVDRDIRVLEVAMQLVKETKK